MLAVRRERRGSPRCAASRRAYRPRPDGAHVVDLVDDQQVEARAGYVGVRPAAPRAAAASAGRRLSQSIDDDQPREVRPRVRVDAARAAQLPRAARVSTIRNSRPNLSRISSRHCSCSAGRADDQHRARAVAQEQLLHDQPGLDRLAQADVVGDQQVRTRHRQRPDDRIELVVLDRDRRLRNGACSARRSALGDRAPAHGVEERVELAGVVEAVAAGPAASACSMDQPARLDLPDDRSSSPVASSSTLTSVTRCGAGR